MRMILRLSFKRTLSWIIPMKDLIVHLNLDIFISLQKKFMKFQAFGYHLPIIQFQPYKKETINCMYKWYLNDLNFCFKANKYV